MKNQTITPLLSTLTKYTAASSELPAKEISCDQIWKNIMQMYQKNS